MSMKNKSKHPVQRQITVTEFLANVPTPNKYNLDIAKIRTLKLGDRTEVCEPIFWRNSIIHAWCINGSDEILKASRGGGYENDYWFGIYDDGHFDFHFTSYEGMCSYDFEEFYNPKEIENIADAAIQAKFLEVINLLIDKKILIF